MLISPLAPLAAQFLTAGYAWLIVLGAFMVVAYFADSWARNSTSLSTQYWGLALYVVAEAFIFLPLLYIAKVYAPDVIPIAGIVTAALFGGLSLLAFTTKADFSWLRGVLAIGGMVALGLIVASIIFGFTLGVIFSGAMIVFASAAILYSTSQLIHEYHTGQHVAAALSLFASVALLFWYVLQLLMSFGGQE